MHDMSYPWHGLISRRYYSFLFILKLKYLEDQILLLSVTYLIVVLCIFYVIDDTFVIYNRIYMYYVFTTRSVSPILQKKLIHLNLTLTPKSIL